MTTSRTLRLVAAAVVVVAMTACNDKTVDAGTGPSGSPSTSAPTTAPTSGPVDGGPVARCPRTTQEVDPGLPDAVPDGATSVRLCDGGADRVTPPVDALTTDVASVVSAVNDQQQDTRRCSDRNLPTYQLAFGYPDGSRFVVAGRFTGCAELVVGSVRRADAGPALHTFVERLLAQRAASTPPAPVDPAALDCAQPREQWTWPLADPTGLTVAVVCVGDPEHPQQARRVTIRPADLHALVASMRTDTQETAGAFCSIARSHYWIVGANAWGDPVTMDWGCVGLTLSGDLDWRPGGPARSIIKSLVAEAR